MKKPTYEQLGTERLCRNCALWKADSRYPNQGDCRHKPPGRNGFPRTTATTWCGGHREKRTEQGNQSA